MDLGSDGFCYSRCCYSRFGFGIRRFLLLSFRIRNPTVFATLAAATLVYCYSRAATLAAATLAAATLVLDSGSDGFCYSRCCYSRCCYSRRLLLSSCCYSRLLLLSRSLLLSRCCYSRLLLLSRRLLLSRCCYSRLLLLSASATLAFCYSQFCLESSRTPNPRRFSSPLLPFSSTACNLADSERPAAANRLRVTKNRYRSTP